MAFMAGVPAKACPPPQWGSKARLGLVMGGLCPGGQPAVMGASGAPRRPLPAGDGIVGGPGRKPQTMRVQVPDTRRRLPCFIRHSSAFFDSAG